MQNYSAEIKLGKYFYSELGRGRSTGFIDLVKTLRFILLSSIYMVLQAWISELQGNSDDLENLKRILVRFYHKFSPVVLKSRVIWIEYNNVYGSSANMIDDVACRL